ncbi:hypothetical protein [Oxalicibacterium faecigallinarum]|uniref:Uncharacterized protein n=1 Tax=Oxalicibacterium faecigallinarum TaxID=573741 RepID=A0A8J3F1C7_9BURK|nr:hypothetical protein [Oxalicibacterium faecigallinarum]GGI16456.1 hypothetical protein GCM10008066_04050 [Oxalicibacterium faecigallinarum]
MTVTTEQQAALEKPLVVPAYFALFDFASAPVRVTNFNANFDWDGHQWSGLGAISKVSEVEESDGMTTKSLNFTLNVADTSLLALAAGAVEEYRGRAATMWMCPLDDQYRLIDEPQVCWRGIMDMMSLGIDGDEGQIVLKCETSAYGLKRQPSIRLNAAQQKKKYPTDTGLDYQNDMISNPVVWLSRRFQQI